MPVTIKLSRVVIYHEELQTFKLHNLLNISKAHDKLKSYLNYQRVYNQQNRRHDDLPSVTTTHKVRFRHVVLWDHETNWMRYIQNTKVPLSTKRGNTMTYIEQPPPSKLQY